MTQIDGGDGWRINNASADGWYAVSTLTGQVLGPFNSWVEANKAIKEAKAAIAKVEGAK
jgi:hypothetical protein